MKALAWTNKGIEFLAAQELKLLKINQIETKGQLLLFDIPSYDNLAMLCYCARSIRGVILLLGSANNDDLLTAINKASFPVWFNSKTSFAARCHGLDSSPALSEAEVGNLVNEKTGSKVDLTNPQVTFLVISQDNLCYFGVDFAGTDLGKRDYKVFSTRQSLKGNVAFSMLLLAGFKPSQVLLDPFGRDGIIGIEAALFSLAKSPHFFNREKFAFVKLSLGLDKFSAWDKSISKPSDIRIYDSLFHNVAAIKKNARIAGVDKTIAVSRIDVDWLDVKMGRESVDAIVSYPPQLTLRSDAKAIAKLYGELFHQAEFVLKKNCRMVLAMHSIDVLNGIKTSLKQEKPIAAYQGDAVLFLVVLQKL
ncbi:MAG: THUMP domain-containing protein [Candidatus Woesearchaeota archaeon]